MFEGTKWWFGISYFLTAMAPAYILFILQLQDDFITSLNMSEDDLGVSRLYLQVLIIIVIMSTVTLLIGSFLKKRITKTNGLIIDFKTEGIHYNKNGEVISFLLGVIFPSVFTFSNNKLISIIIFICIQILLYVLMIKSSSIFPNIIMIIFFSMDIYELTSGKLDYIITFTGKPLENGEIIRLGDSHACNTFIYGGR